ncbi:MAG: TolC family protein [Flammeovirgaceae bacterium]|nr:TolC family protein [Flammeovirgaceae bacterium]
MMRKYIIAAMSLLATVGSATAQVLSIDSCYALANNNYPLIKQYELIEKTKEYTLSNASKAYLPQLSITAIEGYIFGGLPSFGPSTGESESNFKFIGIAQLNQVLWDGGATKTQKKIITASSETEKASIDVALYDLHSRVNQLYFGILLVDEQLAQLEVQNIILSNNVNRIKQLNDNGLALKTDLDEIKVEQLKLNQQKTELKFTRDGYVTMLSLLIGAKIEAPITLQKPALSSALPDFQIIRPELSLYKSQRNMVEAQAGMQRVSLMPKVGLLGAGVMFAPGISFGNSELSSVGVAGLSASWSLSGFYKNKNEKQLTQQSLSKINLQEETFLFNTNLKVIQTSATIKKQKAILAEDDEIVSLRKSIRESYQIKYNTGSGSLMDLLNATEKESEASSQKALHEMQLLITIAEQKTTTGN